MILDLILELDSIVEPSEPEGAEEVRPGEDVKGVLGPRARKLWTLFCQQADLTNAKILAGPPANRADIESAVKIISAEKQRVDMIVQLFWQEVREEVGVPKENLSIRKGWQIVVEPAVDRVTLLDRILSEALTRQLDNDCTCPTCTARRAATAAAKSERAPAESVS